MSLCELHAWNQLIYATKKGGTHHTMRSGISSMMRAELDLLYESG
jgi:hypothetical protein